MKKFSDFKIVKKINEQEVVDTNLTGVEKPGNEVVDVKSEPSKFFSKIFEANHMAHVYHLQVKGEMGSHAEHTALNEYYDRLLDLLDELIETYMGQYEVVTDYDIIDTKETKVKKSIEYFTELTGFIKEKRGIVFSQEDTHLQNIIDEIVALTFRLLYKLKYNK